MTCSVHANVFLHSICRYYLHFSIITHILFLILFCWSTAYNVYCRDTYILWQYNMSTFIFENSFFSCVKYRVVLKMGKPIFINDVKCIFPFWTFVFLGRCKIDIKKFANVEDEWNLAPSVSRPCFLKLSSPLLCDDGIIFAWFVEITVPL